MDHRSNGGANVGIVTVRTTGFNQEGIPVITFQRTVMVYRRDKGPSIPRVAS
jgi:acyl dehydratase